MAQFRLPANSKLVPGKTWKAAPDAKDVREFVEGCQRVYVVEQNRDGQVYRLLRTQLSECLGDRLFSVTHYNGTPIAAENIFNPLLNWEKTFSDPGPLTNGHGKPTEEEESRETIVTSE